MAREHSEHRHGDQPGGSGAGKWPLRLPVVCSFLRHLCEKGQEPALDAVLCPSKMLTTRLLLWLAVLAYKLSVNIA